MAASQPGPRYKGWWFDPVNSRLSFYYNGTLVGFFNGSTFEVDAAANFDGAVDFDSTVDLTGSTTTLATANRVQVARLGSAASLASDGANALISDIKWVAPYNLQIVSAWAANISASDVTVGTATSSASYRRVTLITNTAGTGSGTNIVASLNATASLASNATRSFTTVASTVPAGAIVMASQLTVGAATADGTDAAARIYEIAYIAV